MDRLYPRKPVPDLELDTLQGKRWSVRAQTPASFTMIVFYRGLHCPICSKYLKDLDNKLGQLAERGVEVVAVSTDPRERAAQAQSDWKLESLPIGYGLSIEAAREWGLYISSSNGMTSAGVAEPAHFAEPGLFLIKPDGTLYFASIQSMPFARPSFGEILSALDFVQAKDYPARGEVVA